MKDEYNKKTETRAALIYCRVSSTKQRLEGSGAAARTLTKKDTRLKQSFLMMSAAAAISCAALEWWPCLAIWMRSRASPTL